MFIFLTRVLCGVGVPSAPALTWQVLMGSRHTAPWARHRPGQGSHCRHHPKTPEPADSRSAVAGHVSRDRSWGDGVQVSLDMWRFVSFAVSGATTWTSRRERPSFLITCGCEIVDATSCHAGWRDVLCYRKFFLGGSVTRASRRRSEKLMTTPLCWQEAFSQTVYAELLRASSALC